MVDEYFAICCQANETFINHRREIRETNLNRTLELIDYSVKRMGFPHYAPTRLIVFREVWLQGWLGTPGPYSTAYERVAKDLAIEIPGSEEIGLLADKCKHHNIYIAGTAHEVIPEISESLAFNCAFIIDPKGEVILKYHKFNPYLLNDSRDDVSPHDVFDKYVQVMDGKYGRKKGDIVSCFFPVVDTDIGKLGYIICNDGFYMESSRVLALQGCEVMLRSSGILTPEGSPPQESWEIGNRAHAMFNLMYVVACGSGLFLGGPWPTQKAPGHSMVVDYHGALLCHADYPGEAVTGAVIDIEALRKRREDPKHNWVSQLRTDIYCKAYENPIYKKNLFLKRPARELGPKERQDEQAIEKFFREGIWNRPSRTRNPSS